MSAPARPARPSRITLAGARDDRLFFAQVREDPQLELEALRPGAGDHVVVVSSGGCTALSLLAAGAGRVTAVDLNATQNHLVELKAHAVAALGAAAVAFLGGAPDDRRLERWAVLRDRLSPAARRYWEERPRALRRGVIHAGVSERFIALVVRVMRWLVHPPARVRRLLACRSLAEQRALYEREWDSRRWRWLFAALLNRWTFDRAYDPAFFASVTRPSFAAYFHETVGRGLTELPVATNYFLHQMLTGHYPLAGGDGALPPYLGDGGAAAVAARLDRLALVDGALTSWLRTQPAASVHAFALSNIGEWMDAAALDALFAEIARTATPGARLVFRNFVGWTEVPARWRDWVTADAARGEALSRRDRSLLQRRIVVCRVTAPARTSPGAPAPLVVGAGAT